jgi:DNA-binding NtrC family response regulator
MARWLLCDSMMSRSHTEDSDLFRSTLDEKTGPLQAQAYLTEEDTVAVRRFRLRVVEGPDAGAEVISENEELTVGTMTGNSLVLTDGTISRHHMVIELTPRGHRLRDVGSLNGTFVGGFRVETAYLTHGAVITVGRTRVVFELMADEVRHALSRQRSFGAALGQSPAMRRIFATLPRIAATDATVLLEGETGTGKGLIAEEIHRVSLRSAGPFVVVDCGAIPPALIESELFGHERGAFSGAVATRVGAFEAAHGGTVFLDEVGELPVDMQPKLLRALDRRVITRVGSNQPLPLDVRVIAATNRDLRQEMNRGRFRADLYYRLAIVSLRLPSLSERPEDIALLAEHFWEHYAGPGRRAPRELLTALTRREWPGNVRELRNAVARAVFLEEPSAESAAIAAEPEASAASLTIENALDFQPGASFRRVKEAVMARWERVYLRELLHRHGGNLSRAARAAAMDRNHLRDLLERHGLLAKEC